MCCFVIFQISFNFYRTFLYHISVLSIGRSDCMATIWLPLAPLGPVAELCVSWRLVRDTITLPMYTYMSTWDVITWIIWSIDRSRWVIFPIQFFWYLSRDLRSIQIRTRTSCFLPSPSACRSLDFVLGIDWWIMDGCHHLSFPRSHGPSVSGGHRPPIWHCSPL